MAAMALATLVLMSCGQIYRPVVIPINTTPPNPANFHAVFGISANVPFNPGTALQIDVSGDTDIGSANMGVSPTHMAILPNNSRVFVASAGSQFAGGADVVTSFFPANDSSIATGLGSVNTFPLPNAGPEQSASITSISEASAPSTVVTVTLSSPITTAAAGGQIVISGVNISGYDGAFTIVTVNGTSLTYSATVQGLLPTTGGTATTPIPSFCSYLPDFVATSQLTAVYVANYGVEAGPTCSIASTDSIAQIDPTANTITNIAYLAAASHPVAMVETPDSLNLYVLNEGSSTVPGVILNLSPTDLTTQATIPLPAGSSLPTWAVARVDGSRLYLVTQGDGSLLTINTATNTVLSVQSLGGPGANFVLYDKSLNRLYATNPSAGAVYVFDATSDPPTPLPNTTGALNITAPSVCAAAGSCSPVAPVSVAALPDGSRFYVASYVTATGNCPDPNLNAVGCVIPQVTVFDAGTFAVKTKVFPLLPAVAAPVANVQPFALPSVPYCAPVIPYTPATARFRMFAAAAADSSRVYASMCDGGSVAIVSTTTSTVATGVQTTDVLVTDLLAPFSAGPPQANHEPLPQNPIFLLTGQ